MAEPDVMLTAIQMRRPDIAYFTDDQIQRGRQGEEVVRETDQACKLDDKITAYFKAGVQVIWNILPEQEVAYVYTSCC